MAAPRLAALLASEAEEQAVLQAYQRDEGELVRAIQNRNTPTLCMLAKALPYKTLAAAAAVAAVADDSSCGAVRSALAWWDPVAEVRALGRGCSSRSVALDAQPGPVPAGCQPAAPGARPALEQHGAAASHPHAHLLRLPPTVCGEAGRAAAC